MTEREQNKLVVDGFLLGLRVVYQAYDINIPGTDDHKLWDLLRDVRSAPLLRKKRGHSTFSFASSACGDVDCRSGYHFYGLSCDSGK
jgi:hypothetical protein